MAWLGKTNFTLLLMITTIVGLSLSSPLMVWGFMELNLLLFVPIIGLTSKNKSPNMLSMKYFFIQSLASVIFFVMTILLMSTPWSDMGLSVMLSGSLMWKLGMPPFHLWLFNLMMDLDWVLFFIMASWQKVLPLYLLSQLMMTSIDFFIVFSLYISVKVTLFQVSMKKMMILSSVFTGAWVFTSMLASKTWWAYIFLLYSVMLFFCILVFHNNKMSLLESNNFYAMNIQEKFNIFFLLLSMAGLPPLLGFFIKLLILLTTLHHLKGLISLLMVVSSILMIYMYLSVFLSFALTQTLYSKNFFFFKAVNWVMVIFLVHIMGPVLFFML